MISKSQRRPLTRTENDHPMSLRTADPERQMILELARDGALHDALLETIVP